MPSLGIHIYIADRISKKLNINRDEFIIGNVLPDVFMGWIVDSPSKKLTYEETHLGEKTKINNNMYTLPNYEKYTGKVVDTLTLGYYCHILTDYFFNRYTFENKYVKSEKDEYLGYNSNLGFIKSSSDDAREAKQLDFKIMDSFLVKWVDLDSIKVGEATLKKLNNLGFTNEDIMKSLEFINNLKCDISSYTKDDMKMFSYDELRNLVNECTLFIIDKVKDINIKSSY